MSPEIKAIAGELQQNQLIRYGTSGKTLTEFMSEEAEIEIDNAVRTLFTLARKLENTPFA